MTEDTKTTETTPKKEIQPGGGMTSDTDERKNAMLVAQKDAEQKAMDEKLAKETPPDEDEVKALVGPFDNLPVYQPVGEVRAIQIADTNRRLGSVQFVNGKGCILGSNWIDKFSVKAGDMLVVDQTGKVTSIPKTDFDKFYAVIDE